MCRAVTAQQSELKDPQPDKPFMGNEGQWKDGRLFYYQTTGYQVAFYKDRVRFALSRVYVDHEKHKNDKPGAQSLHLPDGSIVGDDTTRITYMVWEMVFKDMSSSAHWEGSGKEISKIGYARGWTNGILYPHCYQSVTWKNVYEGVDLEFIEGEDGILKFNYLVSNEQSFSNIKWKINGFDKASIDSDGDIELVSSWGTVTENIPKSYFENTGIGKTLSQENKSVKISYEQDPEGYFYFSKDQPFPQQSRLVIDPMYLDWATYFWGKNRGTFANYTWIYDIEVDKNEYTYLTGLTTDTFPGKIGSYDTLINGMYDAFLCKFSDSGNKIEFFIYIGGSNYEYGYGIAATEQGDCYITGLSSSNNFPTTPGAYQTTPYSTSTGIYTSYITAVTRDGKSLIYSTYTGSNAGYSYSWAIDVNEKGEAFIAPYTYGTYPVTHNILPTGFFTQVPDCYVLKFSSDGKKLLRSTMLGGDGFEYATSIFVDKKDQVYFGGYTTSTNLPVTAGIGGFGVIFRGNYDGFLFKIDTSWKKFLVNKYIGTTGFDYISAITVNEKEEIYIQGIAGGSGLPKTTNSLPGTYSAYIMKMQSGGLIPWWTTFICASGYSQRQRISITAKDECTFAGSVWSNTLNVTSDAMQKNLRGPSDGYIGKMSSDGSIKYLSYFGGRNYDYFYAIQTKRIGCVTQLVTGGWSNSDTSFPFKNPWKKTRQGINVGMTYYGAVAKFRDTLKVDPINLGADFTHCDSVYRLLDAGNYGAKHTWSTGATTQMVIAKQPGTYWVVASYGCDFRTDTVVASVAKKPKIYLPKDSLICDRNTVILDAKNGEISNIRFEWNTGDTTQTIRVTKGGTYTVTYTAPKCPVRTDTIRLVKDYSPKRGLHFHDTLACRPFSINIKSGVDSIIAVYAWNTGDSTQHITVDSSGWYKVKIENVCGVINDSLLVTSDSFPTARYAVDSILCNQYDYFTNNPDISPLTKIQWYDGQDVKQRGFNLSGNYWVRVSNACGNYTDTVKLSFLKSPDPVAIEDKDFCDSVRLDLLLTGFTDVKFKWSNNDSLPFTKINQAGKYWINVYNACGLSSDTFMVNLAYSPTVALGNDTLLCDKASFTLNPLATNYVDQYSWSHGYLTPTAPVTADGTYFLTVSNGCGTDMDSITVAFRQSPAIALPEGATYCDAIPAGIVLTPAISGSNGTLLWNTGSSAPSLAITSAGKYLATYSNVCGQAADSAEFIVVNSPKPYIGIDTGFCGIFKWYLDAGPANSYVWSNGHSGRTQNVDKYGTYWVQVTDNNGCKGADTMFIRPNCQTLFYVPSAFSPNRDGKNDLFQPVSKDIAKLEWKIYNRWGNLVYSGNEQSPGWDGTFNGDPVQDGVYVWTARFLSGLEWYQMKGTVTILR